MAELKNLQKKTVFELKEQLRRQQEILKSVKFIEKLPDKGEKLKTAIKHLEDELLKRKEEPVQLSSADVARVAQLEWSMGKNQSRPQANELDSDDESEEEGDEMASHISIPSPLQNNEIVDPLRLVATSQISQNQPKIISLPTVDYSRDAEPPQSAGLSLRMKRLALNRPAGLNVIKPHSDIVKMSPDNSIISSQSSSNSEPPKYYESLYPLKPLENPPLKVLTLEESLQSEQEQQQKYEESLKSQSSNEPRKLYAYDELLQHGKIPMASIDIIHGERNEYLKALYDVPLEGCGDASEDEAHISEESANDEDGMDE